MALKGTLKDFSLADIFQLIGIQRKTGVLTLKNDKDVVTVAFVDGGVVSADSLHRRLEDRLGTVLVKSGRITEAQLQAALKIQKTTLKRMGTILVENNFIDVVALREALQVQIGQMVYRLFRWRDGEYNFSQEGQVEYDKELVTPMSAESVLMEGARIVDEWPMIEKGIRSFSTVFRRANVEIAPAAGGVEPEEGQEAARTVTLNEQERLVHSLVDGKRTVQEIVERCTLSEFDTCRALYDLISRQLLEEARPPEPKTPTAAPTRAARVEPSRALLGVGYLAIVLLLAGVLSQRAQNWRGQGDREEAIVSWLSALVDSRQVGAVRAAIGRSRLQRIDAAIQVYYLLNRGYPETLKYLVTSHLLKPDAIIDPWGRPFQYQVLPEGYRVSISPSSQSTPPVETPKMRSSA
jgi:uncharacterized protein DUF4388